MKHRSLYSRSISILIALAAIGLNIYCTHPQQQNGEQGGQVQERSKAPDKIAEINATQLPKPFQTPSANNPPDIIDPPIGTKLNLPPGFGINIFADNLLNPRRLAV